MDKLFNVLAVATILVASYYAGYSITGIIYTEFFFKNQTLRKL